MKLSISTCARDRRFTKAMRRIRPRFDALTKEFAETTMLDPIHDAILVGVTDDQPFGSFEEVPNNGGFFQVFAGCNLDSDEELAKQLFQIVRRAIERCPFSIPDRQAFQALLGRHERSVTCPGG